MIDFLLDNIIGIVWYGFCFIGGWLFANWLENKRYKKNEQINKQNQIKVRANYAFEHVQFLRNDFNDLRDSLKRGKK